MDLESYKADYDLEIMRPEAVEAGTVKVVGVDEEEIYQNAVALLEKKDLYDKMAKAVNPYGDGHASERIAKILLEWEAQRKAPEKPIRADLHRAGRR